MTLTSTIGYPTESIKSCYQMHLPLQRAQWGTWRRRHQPRWKSLFMWKKI
jgi:hypothetical protein